MEKIFSMIQSDDAELRTLGVSLFKTSSFYNNHKSDDLLLFGGQICVLSNFVKPWDFLITDFSFPYDGKKWLNDDFKFLIKQYGENFTDDDV